MKLKGAVDGEDAVVAADVAERAVGVAWKDHAPVAAQELDAALCSCPGGTRLHDAEHIVVIQGAERRRARAGRRPRGRARHAFLPAVDDTEAASRYQCLRTQEAVCVSVCFGAVAPASTCTVAPRGKNICALTLVVSPVH